MADFPQPGDVVTTRRADWVIVRADPHPSQENTAMVFLRRPKGQVIYFALFIKTRRGWIMADREPTRLPGVW